MATELTNQINNQSIIPSTDVIRLALTLKMTTSQVVETSVTVNNNSPIQDYIHPEDQTQLTFDNLFYVYMAHAQHQKPQGDKKNALASTKGHLSTTAISLQRSLYKVAVVEKFNVIKGGCWKQKKGESWLNFLKN